MNLFRPSPRGIPLGEAAAYFVGLKKLAGYTTEPDDTDYAPLEADPPEEVPVKEAADKSDADLVETGRQRAITNASSGFTADSLNRGERLGDLLGRLVGGGIGVHAGNPGGSGPGATAVRLGAGALGQHVGGRVGKAVGQELDGYTFRQKQWKEVPPEKTASCAADEIERLSKAYRLGGAGDFQDFGGVPAHPKGHLVPGRVRAESRTDDQGGSVPVPGPYEGLQLGAEAVTEPMFNALSSNGNEPVPGVPEADLKKRFKQAAIQVGLPVKSAALRDLLDLPTQEGEKLAAFRAAAESLGLPKAAAPALPPMPSFEEEEAMANEQAQNELSFYRDRFQQSAQEMGLLQQQNEQLQAQVDEMTQTQQAAMDQATMVQQQSMQNAQAAHEAASNAMQQTMQAQQEALANKQESMQVRDHLQSVKQTLVDVASQIPDIAGLPTTPAPAVAGAPAGPQDPNAAPPPDPAQQPQAAPLPNPPEPPPQEQPKQPGGQSGEGGGSPSGEGGKSEGGDGGKLSIKVGNARLLGALGGAAVGAAGTALESRMPLGGLRGKVQQLEQREQAGGSTFLDAVNLAQSKFRLSLREAGQNHPGAATAAGAGLGALAGMRAAPAIQSLLE